VFSGTGLLVWKDDDVTWELEVGKLPAFNSWFCPWKWEQSYTTLYDIHQTPTYVYFGQGKTHCWQTQRIMKRL